MYTQENLLFLSYESPQYSRTGVYFSGLSGENLRFIQVPPGVFKSASAIRALRQDPSLENYKIVVMSPSHLLAVISKMLLPNTIILDAGWSLSESSLTNFSGLKSILRLPKNLFIDFLSFHLANQLILESPEQLAYVSKRFLVKKEKISHIYTGFNESEYSHKANRIINSDSQEFSVLFRGKFNQEAGFEMLAEVTRILKDKPIKFHIQTNVQIQQYKFSEKTTSSSQFLNPMEIENLYLSADLCLGQLSSKRRLRRTIPHKAFESLYFGKCYLSPNTVPLNTLFHNENLAILLDDVNPDLIAQTIEVLSKNKKFAQKLGVDAQKYYRQHLSQDNLAKKFIEVCSKL